MSMHRNGSGTLSLVLARLNVFCFVLTILIAAFAFSLFSSVSRAEQVFSFGTASRPPFSNAQHSGFYDLVMAETFKRVGVKVNIVQLPFARTLINLKRGVGDAAIGPSVWAEAGFSELRQVPEPVADVEISAFAINDKITILDWKSLRPYNIATIIGWKIIELHNVKARSIKWVRTPAQLFQMLQHDRADVIIYEKWQGLYRIKTHKFNKVKLLAPPLKVTHMHLYVHKRHEALVPRFSEALKAMKQDGTYQRIHSQTLDIWNGS